MFRVVCWMILFVSDGVEGFGCDLIDGEGCKGV